MSSDRLLIAWRFNRFSAGKYFWPAVIRERAICTLIQPIRRCDTNFLIAAGESYFATSVSQSLAIRPPNHLSTG